MLDQDVEMSQCNLHIYIYLYIYIYIYNEVERYEREALKPKEKQSCNEKRDRFGIIKLFKGPT